MKALRLLFQNPNLFTKKVLLRLLHFYKLYVAKDEPTVEYAKWLNDNGDETLRLDYPDLNESSIVFDLGGYMGDFAESINAKYGCKVYLFEPHPKFYSKCIERFSNNDKIIPLNYGLSDVEGEFTLSDSVDGSSFLNPNHVEKVGIKCKIKEFFGALDELNVASIDLMKINIEGGEYPLLLHILASDKLNLVEQYQVQFHNFIDEATSMRNRILASLSKTHERTWCYTFIWENWKKLK